MPTITERDIELCIERFGPEDTSAVPHVFSQLSHDSPESHLPTVADAISGVTAKGEGA